VDAGPNLTILKKVALSCRMIGLMRSQMSAHGSATTLDGFDPLAADDTTVGTSIAAVLEEASKRIVHNILKSYTGYFDVFSELLQNALDAVELRKRREGGNYQPKIWVTIDIPDSIVRVVDNGVGMNEREFK
jgi:signal transduction histidine kinase